MGSKKQNLRGGQGPNTWTIEVLPDQPNLKPSRLVDEFKLNKCGGEALDVCAARMALLFAELGWSLLVFKIFHEENKTGPLRVYVDMPDHILALCDELQSRGGSPITKETLRLARPFDLLEHDFTEYDDDLSRWLLEAFGDLGCEKEILIPVQLGKGVATVLLGGNPSRGGGIPADTVVILAYQILVNIAAWFPEVSHYFEPKRLTTREAQIISFTAGGLVEAEIAARLEISPNTVRTHIENSKRKMNAKNKAHAVALAIEAGEISDLYRNTRVPPSH